MSQDNVVSSQHDIQKYKQKCHDLQKQLIQRDTDILNRQQKLKESHEMETQMLRQDYEKQMIKAKK